MDLGTLLLMAAFAYALGIFWYDLLPAKLPEHVWRVAAYPFALMVFGEAFFGAIDPWKFGGFHPLTAFFASLIGVLVDWAVTQVRHPATTALEMRPAGASH